MDDRIRKLRLRVRALHRGQGASQVRYPEDLRAEITAVSMCSQCFSFYQPRFANLIGSTRMPQIDSRDAGSAILADDFLCSNPDGSLIDRKVLL